MLMVVCCHVLSQGGIITSAPFGSAKYYLLAFFNMLVYCAVDIYGLATGYVMCRKGFKLSRLVSLWLQVVFWSVAVSCLFFVFMPETRTFREMISMFLPILRGRYWFFEAYFVVFLVSPVLNHVVLTLSREKFHLLFAALFLVFGIVPVGALGNDVLRISLGHHFSWMVVLYLIGGYLNVYGIPEKNGGGIGRNVWLAGYFLCALAQLAFKVGMEFATKVVFGTASHGDLLLSYPSPLILGEAICLLMYFKDALANAGGIVSKIVRFVTPGVFSVYIIHVHPLAWKHIITNGFCQWAQWSTPVIFGAVLATAVAVFTVCVTLDGARRGLFRLLRVDQATTRFADWAEGTGRRFLSTSHE